MLKYSVHRVHCSKFTNVLEPNSTVGSPMHVHLSQPSIQWHHDDDNLESALEKVCTPDKLVNTMDQDFSSSEKYLAPPLWFKYFIYTNLFNHHNH